MSPTTARASTTHGHYTLCVALHLLRGAAPLTWRCTSYVALHLLRGAAPEQKGCNAYGSGALPLGTSESLVGVCRGDCVAQWGGLLRHRCVWTGVQGASSWRRTRYEAPHPLRGGAPVTWRCTCYVAVHPNRRGVMPTDRVHHHTNKPNRGYAHLPMGRHCTTGRVRTLLRVCLCGCGPGRSLLLGLA